MKIAIVNYTGTVGKTTLAAHLLSPRMNNAPIFAIETVNETAQGLGKEVQKLKGDEFKKLFRDLILLEDAIIDVGSSNVEAFIEGVISFEDSQTEFDYFLVPVTSGSKEQKEAITTVDALSAMDIPPERILLVFNRVNADPTKEFSDLITHINKTKRATYYPNAAVLESELYDLLAAKSLTIDDVLSDTKDYRALIRNNPDASEQDRKIWADTHVIRSLARSVNRNLDNVFTALFERESLTLEVVS